MSTVHRPTPPPPGHRPEPLTPERVWYASYGSNMDAARLHHYIAGGRPPGSARTYPGCRDHGAPARSVSVELSGVLYFATESSVWTGGRAFYDPDAGGRVWARAHLITTGQFSDIAAQEMYRPPGTDLDLGPVLATGRQRLGPGRYETLVCPGLLAGLPVLTFTAPWHIGDVEPVVPSGAYLRHLASGLLAAGGWDAAAVARYLSRAPGAAGAWTPEGVARLMDPGPDRADPPRGAPER
ncbi:histone deacetylase [Streptomyces sp. NPDC020965]|uniref:histone deacetylase n=1 Tax=Streptomyces sp. NPDC020965 TaxID=3365105 RepID=UPI00378FEA1D